MDNAVVVNPRVGDLVTAYTPFGPFNARVMWMASHYRVVTLMDPLTERIFEGVPIDYVEFIERENGEPI